MDARKSLIAGALAAAATLPITAAAADAPAAGPSPTVVAAATASTTAPQGCPGDAGLSSLERRLLAKYDQDVNAMLGYVHITRNIYLLERYTALAWAETWRTTHPAC